MEGQSEQAQQTLHQVDLVGRGLRPFHPKSEAIEGLKIFKDNRGGAT